MTILIEFFYSSIFILSQSITITWANYAFIDPNNPIVQTQFGPVKGAKYVPSQSLISNRIFDGISYVQFIGIPYAAPPTGVNRFRVTLNSFQLAKIPMIVLLISLQDHLQNGLRNLIALATIK